MNVERHASVGGLMTRAKALLSARPGPHSLLMSILDGVQRHPHRFQPPVWLAIAVNEGEPVAVAIRTPPWKVQITAGPAAAIEALARDALALYGAIPGVQGPEAVAERFRDLWCAWTGVSARAGFHMRLFRCDTVLPPRVSPGHRRAMTEADRPVVTPWMSAFARDIGESLHESPDAAFDRWLDQGGLWLWDHDGPVAMTSCRLTPPRGRTDRVRLHTRRPPRPRLRVEPGRGGHPGRARRRARRLPAHGPEQPDVEPDL